MTSQAGAIPVQSKERIRVVDILRGLGVLGILLVNMASFSGQSPGLNVWAEPLDRAIVLLIRFLVQSKFYSLFSLLFGWGMAMQLERAAKKGVSFLRLFVRRLLILLAFGIAHAVLIWFGDILTTYALLGFVLLLFRKRSDRAILIWVGVVVLSAVVLTLPGAAMDAVREWYYQATAFMRSQRLGYELLGSGSFLEITKLRLQEFLNYTSGLPFYFGNIFGMFLLGLYFGKRRFFHDPESHLHQFRWMLWVGLVLGVVFNGLLTLTLVRGEAYFGAWYRFAVRLAVSIGGPALMLFYVSAAVLLLRRPGWQARLAPLGHVGRMALTNYLLQSVASTLVFYSYGLGLYGRTDPSFGLVLTGLIFVVQVRLSSWWFERYQYGPVEWIWRTLTYGQRQPIRVGQSYGEVLPLPWVQSLRQRTKTLNRLSVFLAVWAVMILWGVGLGFWGARLGQRGLSPGISLPGIVQSPTATPTPTAVQDETPEDEAYVVATPVVRPPAYQPGQLARAGDILSLAMRFDGQAALSQIEALTAPQFAGRQAGTSGGWAAADYIAEQFRALGLQPAGVDGTYFQTFPALTQHLLTPPTLQVRTTDAMVYSQYRAFEDFAPLARRYAGAGQASGQALWGSRCRREDFEVVDVVDMVVVCRETPEVDVLRNVIEHGASGLLLIPDLDEVAIDMGIPFRSAWVAEPLPTFRISPAVVQDLLSGTDLTAADLSITFSTVPLGAKVWMEVTLAGQEICVQGDCRGRNVLGVIPGRDPEYADEVVILGGHYDHMGASPDGTVWPGANDNASGIAAMLEIARSWKEEGYVPRRTVLFAAWDAEEQGLLGSRYYVDHPQYPLENTLATINLDMVGAGTEELYVSGSPGLRELILAQADLLGLEGRPTETGGSDHTPFLEAGRPAGVMIWVGEGEGAQTYHRPSDTAATIEPEKLELAGRMADLTALALVEGEPALLDLLALRTKALVEGNREAFLATSSAGQRAADALWFDDAQSLSVVDFELASEDIQVTGSTASATVAMSLMLPPAGEEEEAVWTRERMRARFEFGEAGWKWAGPDVVALDPLAYGELLPEGMDPETLHVAFSAGSEELALSVVQTVAARYGEIANLLGMSSEPIGDVLLLRDGNELRLDTALSLSSTLRCWVEPGVVKLVQRGDLLRSADFARAVAQLMLANAGVTRTAAPWLWDGLGEAVAASLDAYGQDEDFLVGLSSALTSEEAPNRWVEASAAVRYLREQLGWQGVGDFIRSLGRACARGLCNDERGVASVLETSLQTDAAGFEDAWTSYWEGQLANIELELGRLLSARQAAVLSGDESSFLDTVNPTDLKLVAEQRHWFEDLSKHEVRQFTLEAAPTRLTAEGRLLAAVTMSYELGEEAAGTDVGSLKYDVLFTQDRLGLRWAGLPLDEVRGEQVVVAFPEGKEELAQGILEESEAILEQVSGILGVSPRGLVGVELFDEIRTFRSSISLAFRSADWLTAWSGDGTAVKILVAGNTSVEDILPALRNQLTRALLYRTGVDLQWLIRGVSAFIAGGMGDGSAGLTNELEALSISQALSEGGSYSLIDTPADEYLGQADYDRAISMARDSIQYLVERYGWEGLRGILAKRAMDEPLEDAFQAVTGLTLRQFESEWNKAAQEGGFGQDLVTEAGAFRPEEALEHVDFLQAPELAGREPGSSGAMAAADYVAEKFAQYGLIPVGDLPESPNGTGDEGSEEPGLEPALVETTPSFYQAFPVRTARWLAAPSLSLHSGDGSRQLVLTYRQDFVLPSGAFPGGGSAQSELVWIQEAEYEGFDLGGRIAVRELSGTLAEEAARAYEHGASALLVVGKIDSDRLTLSKEPVTVREGAELPLPVLELSKEGMERLLDFLGRDRRSLINAPPAERLGVHARIDIPLTSPEEVRSVNVLGLLPGSETGPRQRVIILGAHYDHVGDDPDQLLCAVGEASPDGEGCDSIPGLKYPGANQSTSGLGVLLEIARLFHDLGFRPQHSILFAVWGAQEAGQVGMQHYRENPVFPLQDTLAVIQLDAAGGGKGYYLEAHYLGEEELGLVRAMAAAESLIEGRFSRTTGPVPRRVPVFREAGVPELYLRWRGADQKVMPAAFEIEVDPNRLGVTGRMVALMLMFLAG